MRAPGEQSLFPGALVVALALGGLLLGRSPPLLRIGLGLGVALLGFVALGAGLADGAYGYRFLYDYAPGWDSVRTPGRLMTLISLALALLAAMGAGRVLEGVGAGRARARTLIASGLCGVVLLEGFNLVDLTPVPRPPPGQRGAPAPQMHVPSDLTFSQLYAFWSIEDDFPTLLNGGGSTPDTLLDFLERPVAARFPDEQTVRWLRRAGVRSVVFHPELAPGTPWEGFDTRPVPEGLPVRRRASDGVVVYEVEPASAGR